MAVRFYDSFDHYSTSEILQKWTSNNGGTINASGRNGSSCLYLTGGSSYTGKGVNNLTTFIVGTAYQYSSDDTTWADVIRTYDGATLQLHVRRETNGAWSILRNGTNLETSSEDLTSPDGWYYIELKATIDNSSGSYEVKINDTTILSDSGVDTQATANAYINEIRCFNYRASCISRFDDFYISDTTGDAPQNDFLGDVRAELLLPDSSGTYAQWQVTGSASHYLAVDDATPDTTTYTYATGSSIKDTFSMQDSSIGDGTIYAIQPLLYARKDDAGEVKVDTIARIGGTDYTLSSGSWSLGDSYTYYGVIEEENPNTSGSWSVNDINNIEIGYNRSA